MKVGDHSARRHLPRVHGHGVGRSSDGIEASEAGEQVVQLTLDHAIRHRERPAHAGGVDSDNGEPVGKTG